MATIRQCVWEGVGGLKGYNENTIVQPKLDGSQYHLHIKNGKPIALTSRRVSKRTGELSEKLHHFPELDNYILSSKKETIIVCEVSADHLYKDFKAGKIKNKKGEPFNWDKRSNYVASIMNSNESENHGLVLVAFDVMYWHGKNVEHLDYDSRLRLIEDEFDIYDLDGEGMNSGDVYCIDSFDASSKHEVDAMFKWFTENKNLEGVIVKDLTSSASQKIKREKDADCIIIGYVDGTGKYAQNNWIGSIVVGVFDKPPKNIEGNKLGSAVVEIELEKRNLIEVGKISGFDEAFRKQISQFKKKFLGRVVQCKYMQWTGKKMRHPRIGEKAIRTDKLIKRCTLEQFQES